MQIFRHSYHKKLNVEFLRVVADIHFDRPDLFCGRTWMSLIAWKEKENAWDNTEYTIQIVLHDQDDYDIGFVYYPEPNQFDDVLHELINWMNDLEHGVICHDDFVDTYNTSFFPDYLGCKRKSY